MNDNLTWIKGIINDSNWEYKTIPCPLLVDKKCSSYEERPSCCRNYPQESWYCTTSRLCKISVIWLIWSEVESNSICFNCKSLCCEWILVPKHVEFTKVEVLKWLDISCEDCRNMF